jgi:sec-independent protein translocase protein TatB
MPSFFDGAFIFVLALLLFGPKKLPELARQVGKLMAEFRRASNEFRMQMDEELRMADQAEQQKKIAAMEAAAPITQPIGEIEPEHPHLRTEAADDSATPDTPPYEAYASESVPTTPLPIAAEGDLAIMPPATGLPTPRSGASMASTSNDMATDSAALAPIFNTIPHVPEPETQSDPYAYTIAPPVITPMETAANPNDEYASSLPDRHTHTAEETPSTPEASLHG